MARALFGVVVRRLTGYDVVRISLGVLLLTAAGLKAHQLATEQVLSNRLLDSRWVLIGVVEFALLFLFFGVWLLASTLREAGIALRRLCAQLLVTRPAEHATATKEDPRIGGPADIVAASWLLLWVLTFFVLAGTRCPAQLADRHADQPGVPHITEESGQQITRTPRGAGSCILSDSRGSGPYCGIYSLYVCLSALGIETKPGDFVSLKYVGSYRGSTAHELVAAARDFGAQAECFSHFTHRELRLVQTPMVLHMRRSWADADFNHWVAFLGCDGDRMRIIDAPHPLETVSASELLANWDGSAIAISKDRLDQSFLVEGRIEYVVGMGWLLLVLYGLRKALGSDSRLPLGIPFRVRAKTFACQAGVIVAFALLLGLGYHASSDLGFLGNPAAVAEVTRRHYSIDIPEISLTDTEREIRESQALVLDARRVADYRRGALPGARSMAVDSTLSERQEVLANVPKDKRIIVYCQSAACGYADEVARFLKFNGYTNLAVYRDGYRSWIHEKHMPSQGVLR